MKVLLGLVALIVSVLAVQCGVIPSFSPLYGYEKNGLHYYTTSLSVIGTGIPATTGRLGYRSEGVTCILQTNRAGSAIPLHRYYKHGKYLLTTNSTEINASSGYRLSRAPRAGYCYPLQVPNTVPLYRYHKQSTGDRLYTTDANRIGVVTVGHTGNYEYMYEGITCFVYKYHA